MLKKLFILNSCLLLLIANYSYSNNQLWYRFNYPKMQQTPILQEERNFATPVSASEFIPEQDNSKFCPKCCTGSSCCVVALSCAYACYNCPFVMTGASCLGCCYACQKIAPVAIFLYSRCNVSPKKIE